MGKSLVTKFKQDYPGTLECLESVRAASFDDDPQVAPKMAALIDVRYWVEV